MTIPLYNTPGVLKHHLCRTCKGKIIHIEYIFDVHTQKPKIVPILSRNIPYTAVYTPVLHRKVFRKPPYGYGYGHTRSRMIP